MPKKQEQESYDLDPQFENTLVTMACHKPRFYGRVGKEIKPDLLGDKSAKLAMKAAHAIANDLGNGPDSLVLITQRLKRWHDEGKVTQEDIDEVMDFFDDAEDVGFPAEESMVEEIRPVLQYRVHEEAVKTAIDTLGKRGDMDSVKDLLTKADRIGYADTSLGSSLSDFEAEVNYLKNLVRLPTGIPELDGALMGGPERGSAFCFVGGTGDGKSMGLVQIAAHACLTGLNVAYASLELNKPWTLARIIANITGLPTNSLFNGSKDDAEKILAPLKKQMGILRVEKFTPKLTTLDDIKAWVQRIEEHEGIKIHVVIIDYADKLTVAGKEKKNEYVDMGVVFEGFRVWMEETQRWGWTAAQAKRKDKDSKKRIEIDDISDSQNKPRVLDGVITLNRKNEGKLIVFFIAKNRNGEDHINVGPLETEFECARIAPVSREYEMNDKRYDYDPEIDGIGQKQQQLFDN